MKSDPRILVKFTVPGQPQGKGRARAFDTGKRDPNGRAIIGHHTPSKTKSYEGVITSLAMEAMGAIAPVEGPLMLKLGIFMDVPRSWPVWKKKMALDGIVMPTTKPDSDNIEKAVKDALNGVVWMDDCQICDDLKRARYSKNPRVEVTVYRSGGLPAQTKRNPNVAPGRR